MDSQYRCGFLSLFSHSLSHFTSASGADSLDPNTLCRTINVHSYDYAICLYVGGTYSEPMASPRTYNTVLCSLLQFKLKRSNIKCNKPSDALYSIPSIQHCKLANMLLPNEASLLCRVADQINTYLLLTHLLIFH